MAIQELLRGKKRNPILPDVKGASFSDFVDRIGVMSRALGYDIPGFNSTLSSDNTDKSHALPRPQELFEFSFKLRELGFEEAISAIDQNAGTPINVRVVSPNSRRVVPGVIVGVKDAVIKGEEKYFTGAALVNAGRDNALVNIRVKSSGETSFHVSDAQPKNPSTEQFIADLYK